MNKVVLILAMAMLLLGPTLFINWNENVPAIGYSGVVRQSIRDAPRAVGQIEIEHIPSIKPIKEPPAEPAGVIGQPGSAHSHQTFLVYIHGKQYSFGQAKYLGKSPHVHLHDWPFEIHTHATGITLGYFFKTIGISFDEACLALDTGDKYCEDDHHSLRLFVNGKESSTLGKTGMSDMDKYLITYGNETLEEISRQINKIPDIRSSLRDNAAVADAPIL